MKTFRCSSCNYKIKYGWWNINRYWRPNKKGYKCINKLQCPKCKTIHEISFWKTPLKAKLQFIKELLESF